MAVLAQQENKMQDLDLFSAVMQNDDIDNINNDKVANMQDYRPLAERMRPNNFDEYIGQEKILGKHAFLRRMIQEDKIPSMILYGPPGTGKTTLAKMIAGMTKSDFVRLNAVSSGISDVRKIIDKADEQRKYYHKRTIIFLDEIHRFNKAQQDVLLPYVEDGRIVLIGATTENPFFEVNHALLSRVRVVKLELLNETQIVNILNLALHDEKRGLGKDNFICDKNVLMQIAQYAGGDARSALNILEQASDVAREQKYIINEEIIENVLSERIQTYDKNGDNHYDIVSAFIKSMRGSDADAAIHYLARMLVAGEDINFIARRIAVCAAEDVGNADPNALVVAMAMVNAVQFLGMPEARIPLAQAVTYIATAPKSNASYLAIDKAIAQVKAQDCGQVPIHLRDCHYKGAKKLGHGVDYKYAHDFPYHIVKQQYLPDKIKNAKYYIPTTNGYEKNIGQYMNFCQKLKEK